MHMLIEIARVLEDGGTLILSTPNMASYTAVARILEQSAHPQVHAKYPDPRGESAETEITHVREYTPPELRTAIEAAGFEIENLFTESIPGEDNEIRMKDFLERSGYSTAFRGEQMYCIARHAAQRPRAVVRYPHFLYEVGLEEVGISGVSDDVLYRRGAFVGAFTDAARVKQAEEACAPFTRPPTPARRHTWRSTFRGVGPDPGAGSRLRSRRAVFWSWDATCRSRPLLPAMLLRIPGSSRRLLRTGGPGQIARPCSFRTPSLNAPSITLTRNGMCSLIRTDISIW